MPVIETAKQAPVLLGSLDNGWPWEVWAGNRVQRFDIAGLPFMLADFGPFHKEESAQFPPTDILLTTVDCWGWRVVEERSNLWLSKPIW